MKLTGAQILIKMIKDQGVTTIFGYPGGAVIDIYDELDRHEDLRHILVRHEQGAVHMADAYARARGGVGVALVTSGPGATNTVTGIASAYMDSIPVVIFTGQVPTGLIGNDAFQEVDIVGITRPCTKHNYLVKDINKLAKTIKDAFYIATSGRPGPVLVDLPKDIMAATIEFKDPGEVNLKSYRPTYDPNKKQLAKVVKMIKKAKKTAYLCWRRGGSFQVSHGTHPSGPVNPHAGDCLLDGAWGLSRLRSPVAWNARNARHLSGQHGYQQL